MLGWLRNLGGSELDSYGFLRADMHAHWLPGIDDGAKSMEESLAMIRALRAMGYRKLIATPHIMTDLYKNTPSIIEGCLAEVRKACREAGIDMELHAAAEYLIDEGFEEHLALHGPLLMMDNHLLVEFGFYQAPMNVGEILFNLMASGYKPIIAHPERYGYYHGNIDRLRQMKERGASLQVNTLSILGHYGKSTRKMAVELIRKGLVDFLGTDAHSEEHLRKLRSGLSNRHLTKLIGSASFQNSAI